MGKSSASCFKIMACGSDSNHQDDLQMVESKSPSIERGWSFRKRSSRNRVLNNTVISEAPSHLNKQSPEPTDVVLQVKPNLTVPEKTSAPQRTEEKTKLSALMDSEISDSTADREDDCRADATLSESSIILIQAAIRGYLAKKVVLKWKNIIKVQAAVRGCLVRRHAIGTLRCMQAIIKMQALVRARRGRLFLQGLGDFEKQNESSGKDNLNTTTLRSKREAKLNSPVTDTSTKKLISNKFARQLMESTQRTKPINIKCDLSKSDSTWKWFERWMSVSFTTNEDPQESGLAVEQHEKENLGESDGKRDILFSHDFCSESAETSENDDNLITYEVKECGPIEIEDTCLISKIEERSLQGKEETGYDNFFNEQPESEGKKLSRKASNPVFITAQSKFEELSSAKTILSSGDLGVASKFHKEIALNETSISNTPAVQIAGSECGTELSISSTLDSPDRSEAGVNDFENKPKISDVTDRLTSREHLRLEANSNTGILGTELSYGSINQLERHENIDSAAGECVNSVIDADPLATEKKPDASQEASARSRTGVPESEATPSSQVSDKTKKKSQTSSKINSSRSTPNHSSAKRASVGQSQDEHKTRKRRSSFGSEKLDHADQEPRDSSSSISVPSYMLATEAAKAKALANGSPKSSPDVQDKNINNTKRYSLPGTNERQGSPRVHRSVSQAQQQQNAKGNGLHSPHDRKWRR